jgi:Flp pilus assembly protein TadB
MNQQKEKKVKRCFIFFVLSILFLFLLLLLLFLLLLRLLLLLLSLVLLSNIYKHVNRFSGYLTCVSMN